MLIEILSEVPLPVSSTMLPTDIFEALYNTLLNDKRLNVCHKNKLANPFPVSGKGIMELAHVNSIVTYHKCIGLLEAYGYIRYYPSYSYYNRSTIYLDNSLLNKQL